MQFDKRIQQRIGYAEIRKRWAHAAHGHFFSRAAGSGDNQSRDQDIFAALDTQARGDVLRLWRRRIRTGHLNVDAFGGNGRVGITGHSGEVATDRGELKRLEAYSGVWCEVID